MSKIRIIEVTNDLGLGGTEYTLQLFSKYINKEIFDLTVIALKNGGPRVQLLIDLGIDVKVLNGNYTLLSDILKNVDVLHWHGSGSINENYQFFEVIKDHKPKLVIQTNVFGMHDNHLWYNELIDYDLYVSKMILCRRMSIDHGLPKTLAEKRKVLTNPVDVFELRSCKPTSEVINEFKRKHHLIDHFIVGRVGRASDAKFDFITLDAFKELLKLNSKSKLLINGITLNMRAYIKKLNLNDHVVEVPNTSELRQLVLYYSVMDVFLACSAIGESFGMVIAEAMALGTPVVTINTPDLDNAQIEVVDNGVNGYVTNRSKKALAEALYKLSIDSSLRIRFSEQAEYKISSHYEAKITAQSLEKLILEKIDHQANESSYNNTLVLNWSEELLSDYKSRLKRIEGKYSLIDKVKIKMERNKFFKRIMHMKNKLSFNMNQS